LLIETRFDEITAILCRSFVAALYGPCNRKRIHRQGSSLTKKLPQH